MKKDVYSTRNANLANLCGMFETCLHSILLYLDNNDFTNARHHIDEMLKSLLRLKERQLKGG